MTLEAFLGIVALASVVFGGFIWYSAWQSKRAIEGRNFEKLLRPDDEESYLPNASELEWRRKMIDRQNERGW